MRTVLIAAAAAVTLVSQVSGQAPAPVPQKVELTFAPGGLVTLVTREATVREILIEWTRKTGAPFVGADRLTGTPLTLEFKSRPETEVLASILRGAAGYVVGPRAADNPSPSAIDVVYIIATSTPTSGGYSAPPPMPAPQPQMSTSGNPDGEIQPVAPGRGGQVPPPAPGPQGSPAPPYGSPMPGPRPVGVNPVAVPIVTVPVGGSPTPTPTPTGTGRGGGGGSR